MTAEERRVVLDAIATAIESDHIREYSLLDPGQRDYITAFVTGATIMAMDAKVKDRALPLGGKS